LWVIEIEPLAQPVRFGNPAFRLWHQRLCERAVELHAEKLGANPAWAEVSGYLCDSFGNATRIDYGTGHELHFVAWLLCLVSIGAVPQSDLAALVLRVFARYMKLVRQLQRRYGQEPAGSHGVWSLDDYQFIPFIWGAAQLINHPSMEPTAILQPRLVEQYADEYLYFGCIHYINQVKTGPFHEHSPDLYNITAAVNWAKVNAGMQRKYYDDVITKFPIMQHFLFGSIIQFDPTQ
jgi:serine/threonine-protein phosphatase 2A activator